MHPHRAKPKRLGNETMGSNNLQTRSQRSSADPSGSETLCKKCGPAATAAEALQPNRYSCPALPGALFVSSRLVYLRLPVVLAPSMLCSCLSCISRGPMPSLTFATEIMCDCMYRYEVIACFVYVPAYAGWTHLPTQYVLRICTCDSAQCILCLRAYLLNLPYHSGGSTKTTRIRLDWLAGMAD